MTLDPIDIRLLAALQENAMLTAQELGALLNLSASQAGRRRQRLEAQGIIRGYGARIDAQMAGLTVQAFVQVQMASHAPQAARSFATMATHQREIISVWTLTGEADYMLQVYCSDLSALNRLIQQVLLPHEAVARVQSKIVMAELKSGAPLAL